MISLSPVHYGVITVDMTGMSVYFRQACRKSGCIPDRHVGMAEWLCT